MPVTEQQIAKWEKIAGAQSFPQMKHLGQAMRDMQEAIPLLIADLREARAKLAEVEKDAKRRCEDSERLTHILTNGMPARAGGKYWYRDGILFTTAIDCIDAAITAQEKP